ncbi:hypothetical protein N9R79_07685 [Vibrio sp.]|nr:hypothetical protein [Vibrio sp.]
MDVLVELKDGRVGILENCDDLKLEGQTVKCWVEEKEGFELATAEVSRIM